MRNHYNLDNLRRSLRNPRLIRRELHRLLSLPLNHAYGCYVDKKLTNHFNVMTKDWDNLLILDACRFDFFEKQHNFSENPKKVVSPGTGSWEFMEKTFLNNQFHDTIYVTSNPYASRLPDETFFQINYLTSEWDQEVGTIHPDDVVTAAYKAYREHPNKRLIIHFMQPHRPYLGPTAEQLRERVDLIGFRNEGNGLQIWGAVKEGKVTVEEVRKAYSETLDIVLREVSTFLEEIDGKSAITADHGEMLGERVFPFTSRVWGHSEGFRTPQLLEVPWLEIPSSYRREVVESPPIVQEKTLDDDEVEERLEALGYV